MGYLGGVLGQAPNVTRITTIGDLFGIILNVAIGAGVSISVIYIGLAGVRFIMSSGDPKSADQAKHALTYAIVALLLTIGAVLVKFIILNNILGVTGELENTTTSF
jgi:hypothetical protein